MSEYDKIIQTCCVLEKLAENDSERAFLSTASVFFNELAVRKILYPEARDSFVKKVVHDLECAL